MLLNTNPGLALLAFITKARRSRSTKARKLLAASAAIPWLRVPVNPAVESAQVAKGQFLQKLSGLSSTNLITRCQKH